MAAPLGNHNAAKSKMWSAAIQRALAERSRLAGKEALDQLAGALLDKAGEGDMAALKELGDRLDGKAVQAVAGADGEGPVMLSIQWALPKSS